MAHRPYDPRDHYSRKAREESFVARSIYKLEELDGHLKLIREGDRVVDLGCAPGSWLQYAQSAAGPRGKIVGIDLSPVRAKLGPTVSVLERDVDKVPLEEIRAVLGGAADVVLSDMAPHTSGVRFVDQVRSQNLCDSALAVARGLLRPGGRFLVKVFQGPDTPAFVKELRRSFEAVESRKPRVSRSESMEIYLAGKGFRAETGAAR